MNKSKIIKWFGTFLSIVSMGFVIFSICKMGFDFSFVGSVPVFIVLLIAGIGMKMFSLLLSSTAWTGWLKFFSRTPFETLDAQQVFIRANIGRYIPGNVMHFVQRNLFATEMGISQLELAMSSVFEVMSYVAVALCVALLTARENLKKVLTGYFGDKLPMLGIAVAVAGVTIIMVLVLLRKKIKAVLGGHTVEELIRTLTRVAGLQLATLTMLGAAMLLLVWYAQGTMTLPLAGTVISTYIVAWVLGFIVPGASGGIGIREIALLLLLGPVLGDSLVLSLAVIHRLITIIGDFAGYLIVLLTERKNRGKEGNA